MADYLRTEIEDADGAAAVPITIDTPGGLDSSMREIVQAIQGVDRRPGTCRRPARGPPRPARSS